MKILELKPIREFPADYDAIEKRIRDAFKNLIFIPLIRDAKVPESLLNAPESAVIRAIKSGKINFSNGQFLGKFNATLSKELREMGAKWDRKTESYKILKSRLSEEVVQAINVSEFRFTEAADRINRTLNQINPTSVADSVKLQDIFESTIWKVEKEFEKSIQNLTIAPKMTQDQAERISLEYTNNLRLYIKDWTQEEIVNLRNQMQKHIFRGYRYDAMVDLIQKRYDVSKGKAKFLARQETSLLMTKYKQTRYEAAGVNEYIWGCVAGSKNHPVRPMHEALKGKKFRWDSPPVTDHKGNRNNPGQDYGCRCFARPIVKFI